jgi:hypothetical protein
VHQRRFTREHGPRASAANDNFGPAGAIASVPNRTSALVGAPRDGSVEVLSINSPPPRIMLRHRHQRRR